MNFCSQFSLFNNTFFTPKSQQVWYDILYCNWGLLFIPVSITTLIGTEDARFILNGISSIAKGDLKWRDALLVTCTVNSNNFSTFSEVFYT